MSVPLSTTAPLLIFYQPSRQYQPINQYQAKNIQYLLDPISQFDFKVSQYLLVRQFEVPLGGRVFFYQAHLFEKVGEFFFIYLIYFKGGRVARARLGDGLLSG